MLRPTRLLADSLVVSILFIQTVLNTKTAHSDGSSWPNEGRGEPPLCVYAACRVTEKMSVPVPRRPNRSGPVDKIIIWQKQIIL